MGGRGGVSYLDDIAMRRERTFGVVVCGGVFSLDIPWLNGHEGTFVQVTLNLGK